MIVVMRDSPGSLLRSSLAESWMPVNPLLPYTWHVDGPDTWALLYPDPETSKYRPVAIMPSDSVSAVLFRARYPQQEWLKVL